MAARRGRQHPLDLRHNGERDRLWPAGAEIQAHRRVQPGQKILGSRAKIVNKLVAAGTRTQRAHVGD